MAVLTLTKMYTIRSDLQAGPLTENMSEGVLLQGVFSKNKIKIKKGHHYFWPCFLNHNSV